MGYRRGAKGDIGQKKAVALKPQENVEAAVKATETVKKEVSELKEKMVYAPNTTNDGACVVNIELRLKLGELTGKPSLPPGRE